MKIASTIRRFLPGTAFVIEIRQGEIRQHSSQKIPSPFLSTLKDKLESEAIESGAIYGVRQSNNITLAFSKEIPKNMRQPLLNTWHIHKQKFR
ncbi:DUF3634 family protein [Rubellicoccus peritrichatus]|uniref:DUF3634 family protein n=1 Tax=Rubellicoccus peritrichatus TaxID=3080537 RepID=A0AAQ3LEE0_9BACT|nr:DUF3634 family protein [Puniceicoccus sp. CR14]WOO43014.1 DUF3634 family protein [Puniceicoccus sp. CR14]